MTDINLVYSLLCVGPIVMTAVVLYFAILIQMRKRKAFQPEQIVWEAVDDELLTALLHENKKIEAIQRYRELTSVGLGEANQVVDYLLDHLEALRERKQKAAYDSLDAGIRDLVAEGRIDEAVEVYQKFAGVDEYTARDAVEQIRRDRR